MNLSAVTERFVLHWGEMGSRWGVNRTVAQMHALLYITGRPMHAEEMADALGVARSNISNSLRELQSWKLARLVHIPGDRRDHFDTTTDVWELVRTIIRERQEREIAPTMEVLRELLGDPSLSKEPAATKLRMAETLELMTTLTAWSDEMLRLDTATLQKVLTLGAKVKKLMGRESGFASASLHTTALEKSPPNPSGTLDKTTALQDAEGAASLMIP
jgi:DNA-binding transcriptional regulator GbsR (MarR family)